MRFWMEHVGNENRTYCAADKFWLSLVSLLMREKSDTHFVSAIALVIVALLTPQCTRVMEER
jgi:hypothetical protein